MKRMVTKEQSFCDACSKESPGYYSCDECKTDFCYECAETSTVKYSHGVGFSGSGDGMYCRPCDKALLERGDAKHRAYLMIKSLRDEETGWYERFKKRVSDAEAHLAALSKARPPR